ncbi:MAG: AAA family ATPase [Myxococcota bacterium]
MSASTLHDISAAIVPATLEQGEAHPLPSVDTPTARRGRPIELGSSNFVKLRKFGRLYVDKSSFISHILEAGPEVMLCTRPRRFGKTTNLAMLQAYFEKRDEDFTPYFQDLQIWKDAAAREHFQRYPVIFFTFKDCKARTWEHCRAQLHATIQNTFRCIADAGKAPTFPPASARAWTRFSMAPRPPKPMSSPPFDSLSFCLASPVRV